MPLGPTPFAAVNDPFPAPAAGEVFVWRVSLDRSRAEVEALRSILSQEEIQRADRFRSPLHAGRFVAGRGTLRCLIASCLGENPRTLPLKTTERGKPFLALQDCAGEPLHFNLAHAGPLALYAVTRCAPVGIDVEARTRVRGMDQLAQRVFSSEEQGGLHALPPDLREEGFLLGWTRKEALLKATGQGIGGDLRSFDVSLDPGEPARLLHWPTPDGAGWTLTHLEPGRGYVGALAVLGPVERLHWIDTLPAVLRESHNHASLCSPYASRGPGRE